MGRRRGDLKERCGSLGATRRCAGWADDLHAKHLDFTYCCRTQLVCSASNRLRNVIGQKEKVSCINECSMVSRWKGAKSWHPQPKLISRPALKWYVSYSILCRHFDVELSYSSVLLMWLVTRSLDPLACDIVNIGMFSRLYLRHILVSNPRLVFRYTT